MEKLIKIQAIINQIEEISLEKQYRTQFYYKDSKTMEIETYCKQWAINISMMFDQTRNVSVYHITNTKLEFLELPE